jgi:hypothetical protein
MWRRVSWLYLMGTFLLMASVFFAGVAIWRLVSIHGFFQVKRIELIVRTHESSPRLTPDALNHTLSKLSGSIWTGSLDHLVQKLQTFDWLSDVKIRRVFPNKVSFDIEEREAIALWSDGRVLTKDHELIQMGERDQNWLQKKQLLEMSGAQEAVGRMVVWQDLIAQELTDTRFKLQKMRADYGGSLFLELCDLQAQNEGRNCRIEFVLAVNQPNLMRSRLQDGAAILNALIRQGQIPTRLDLRYPSGAAVILSS